MSTNPNPSANALPADGGPVAASSATSPGQHAVASAFDAIDLATLQGERQRMVEQRMSTADIDAAIARKGVALAPVDIARGKTFEAAGVAEVSKPSDYSKASLGNLASSLPPERLAAVRTEVSDWAARLNLSRDGGHALIERLAQVGPMVGKMTPAEKDAWLASADKVTLRVVGSQEALDALVEKASKLLNERAANSDISKGLVASQILRDPLILRYLSNHSDALALIQKRYGGKK